MQRVTQACLATKLNERGAAHPARVAGSPHHPTPLPHRGTGLRTAGCVSQHVSGFPGHLPCCQATHPVRRSPLCVGSWARFFPPSMGQAWRKGWRDGAQVSPLHQPPLGGCIPITHHGGEPGALLLAGADDPLPELEGDVGDVAGAGDGGGVERCQVRGRDGGPARRLQVDGHQLFLHQHHEGTGVLIAWGGERRLLMAENPPRTAMPGSPGPPQQGHTSLGGLGALHGEEVDDAGGEVERGQGLALQHADAVPVAVAGSWHPPTEDDEGVPGEGMKEPPSEPGPHKASSPPRAQPGCWGVTRRSREDVPRLAGPPEDFADGFARERS